MVTLVMALCNNSSLCTAAGEGYKFATEAA